MTFALRPARSTDAGKIGAILHGFARQAPWMPKLHSGAEAIAFCGRMIDLGWVTVAFADRQVLGFVACDGAEICALYLAPEVCGQGIGKHLLDHVKSLHPRLTLWTFQANEGAQRFYLREGFVEQQRTEGQRNDEGLADIQYLWMNAKSETLKEDTPKTRGSKAGVAKTSAAEVTIAQAARTVSAATDTRTEAKPKVMAKAGADKP